MTRIPRWLIMVGIVLVAFLLAFPLRNMIYETIVIPAAFVGWQVGLYYRSLSQTIWWWVIIAIVLFLLVFSLMPKLQPSRKGVVKSKPKHGQVEDLAVWIGRAKGGVYFKWLVANRLGKLAYQILLLRESGRQRSVFDPLLGEDWKPSSELQHYLEIGLHGSFADFPGAGRSIGAAPKTPLDYRIHDAVDFLEIQVKDH